MGRARVEEDLRQQVVVFGKQSAGDVHMALEGGTRGVLMLHRGSEHHRRGEGDAQRVGHHLVVLLEGVFADVEAQVGIDVFEEDLAQVVALRDDDGVLLLQLAEVGKRGAKHRVGGDVAEAALLVELLQLCLHRGDVGEDAVARQVGNHRFEGLNRVAQRHTVDH